MTERQIIATGALVGAIAGMAVGYLFFTPTGRRLRVEGERQLTAFMQETERLLSAADQVRQSVADLRGGQTGWPRSA